MLFDSLFTQEDQDNFVDNILLHTGVLYIYITGIYYYINMTTKQRIERRKTCSNCWGKIQAFINEIPVILAFLGTHKYNLFRSYM